MSLRFNKNKEVLYLPAIGVFSVLLPLGMAIIRFTEPVFTTGLTFFTYLLPFSFALNTLSLLLIPAAIFAANRQKQQLHRRLMLFLFLAISLFYLSDITYYLAENPTSFADANADKLISTEEKHAVGNLRLIYFLLFLTHTIGGIFLSPLLLLTYYFLLSNQFLRYKKIRPLTLSLWFYTAATYVVLFWMMRTFTG